LAVGIPLLTPTVASADSVTGTLYYTTFNGTAWKVDYTYNGVTFTLGASTSLASPGGADGILFAPDGNLIVAGQNTDNLHEITITGAPVTTVNSGTGAYHMALSGSGPNATLYTLWNGSGSGGSTSIAAVTLSGGGLSSGGTGYTVSCAAGASCSTDVRGLVFDPNNSTWYYGTAPDNGTGDFGTVAFNDAAHTAVLTPLLTGEEAHGLTYDPLTHDIIFSEGGTVDQFDPTTGTVVSTIFLPGNEFDQSAVDGNGHLFVASNSGNLLFVDYDATGLIGSSTFSAAPFLARMLDDVAPLSGAGSTDPAPVPEPTTVLLLGTGLLAACRARRPKTEE
jgi:hypothetical protein